MRRSVTSHGPPLVWPPRSAPKSTTEWYLFGTNVGHSAARWLIRFIIAAALLLAALTAFGCSDCDPNAGSNDAKGLGIVSACALGLAVLLRRFTR